MFSVGATPCGCPPPGLPHSAEIEDAPLRREGFEYLIPIVVALFLGCAGVGDGENGCIEQSFALVQLGADAVNRADRTKGIDHFIWNQIKAPVLVRCLLGALGPFQLFRQSRARQRYHHKSGPRC